jgi:nitrite reductase (NADH) small subunit
MTSASQVRKWYPVAKLEEIPQREGKKILWNQLEVALFNINETYLAIDNRCPHKQGPLSDGLVAGNSVFCPLHNWKIDLGTGCALSGGKGQVKSYPVKVASGMIYIAFEEGAFQECSDSAGQTIVEARED